METKLPSDRAVTGVSSDDTDGSDDRLDEERVGSEPAVDGVTAPVDGGICFFGVFGTPFREAVKDVFSCLCAVSKLPWELSGGGLNWSKS